MGKNKAFLGLIVAIYSWAAEARQQLYIDWLTGRISYIGQEKVADERAERVAPNRFDELVAAYAKMPIEFPHLKPITLAMMMVESGRGTSLLAREHYNFAGLKYRQEMALYARPITYDAHDGRDDYCKFDTIDDFLRGFWAFLDRSPYQGWRAKASDPQLFLEHIAKRYSSNPNYVRIVLERLPEATVLLQKYSMPTKPLALVEESNRTKVFIQIN
ncbi:MAG: glucosaminidase domain-containing protein [Campylobacterales bacterium]